MLINKSKKLLGLILLCMASGSFAEAINRLIDTTVSSLPNDQVEISFLFDSTPSQPVVFAINEPARLAIDLEGTQSALKKKKLPIDINNVQSALVLTSGSKTRIVVNLLTLGKYHTQINGNKLVVTLGEKQSNYLTESKKEFSQPTLTSSTQATTATIENIDFRRGENGEGKLIIELNSAYVDVDNQLQGNDIKLRFSDTVLPEALQLKYDVSDFATPVQWVNAQNTKGMTQITVRPQGDYDYLAYQAGNTYVLTVKPLSEEEIEAKEKAFSFVGDRLSLNFQDIEVRSVLQLIADFTDLNLVASDTVTGKITLRLQNVPWDQALDLILKTKGLDKRQEGNVLLVAPAVEIAQREQQEIQTNKQLEELAPLQTEFIRIRYAMATDIGALLDGGNGNEDEANRLLTERAMVVVDERTNSLLITETASKLTAIRKLINLIDVPVKQVLIEARIVVAASDASESLGIKWGGFQGETRGDRTILSSGSDQTILDIANGDDRTFGNMIDLGVTELGASRFNLGFLSDNGLLNLELSAIESSGNGEVLSQPKVITGDKQNAVIKSGQEVAYESSAPNGGTTISFKDAALILDVTPNITPDNRVIMKLNITQDSLGPETSNGVPTIDTNQLTTEVLVNNGETVVLGGVFSSAELKTVTKTPFLGDIPYLGRFFRKNSISKQKTELLVFVTPKILTDNLVE